MDYAITIDGIDKDTRTWLDSLKLTAPNSDNPPTSMPELEQEGITLDSKIRHALTAKGFYDALIEYHLDKNAKVPALSYKITPGNRYHISAVVADWQGDVLKPIDTATFPIHAGDPVDAAVINDYAVKLLHDLGKDSCLLSLNIVPVLSLDSAHFTAKLTYQIQHGKRAHFGDTVIKGNKEVHDSVIHRTVAWKKDQCFNEDAVTKTRSALIGTQLFSTVKITPGQTPDEKGDVPITVEVQERVAHTITLGTNYATDQGFGVKAGWEHRNFSGNADKVNTDLTLAQQQQTLGITERLPGFLRDDQTLVLTSSLDHQDTDAYTSQAINAGASVERRLRPNLNSSFGVAYLLSMTKDNAAGDQDFGLISTPGFLEYDTRDNAQDARKGLYGQLAVTPYVDTFDIKTDFVKGLMTAQTYFSSDMPGKPTLALRGSFGTIAGAPSTSLPADLRFYAGGGGSVRGYSYQSISPYLNGSPVGGSSLVVLSAELRVRFTNEFGGVLFVDGGNAYASGLPDFKNNLYYGAGAGVRYYSSMGPIRLDVGVPLNGHDIDHSGVNQTGYALYVSIGQSF